MSSLYLALAMFGTFAAVLVVGVAVDAASAGRRRIIEILRAQVPEVDVRRQELAAPFLDRAFVPVVAKIGSAIRRVTPIGMRERIARKLVLAGDAPELADKMAAFKVIGLGCGAVLAYALAALAGLAAVLQIAAPFLGGAMGYLVPAGGIGQRALNRQEAIQRAMPDTIDLLTIAVEAGLGFDAALAHVRRRVPGPLSDEIGRMLQEIQLGVSRPDALRNLAARTDVEELRAFTLAMVQADQYGISIANVLRAQSKELRVKRRQRAEEKAQKVPTKLLFPLIFCILPAMFIALLGPGAIKLINSFVHVRF
jgi:tight adherence protein C